MTAQLLALALTAAFPQASAPPYARAESLRVAGELAAARELLEPHVNRNDPDVGALTLLGRVHLAWPTVGRWAAWDLLERAARMDPDNPEPRYWQLRVGLALRGDDGERLMRDALYHLWELDPDYRDSWEIWQYEMYHSAARLRRIDSILARRAGDPAADWRRAQLLAEAGRYEEADELLAGLIAGGRDDAPVWALRAQCAFEQGDVERGQPYYDEALARAASDSTHLLWHQVEGIAAPEEKARYISTTPEDRARFFRAFWARREPDVTSRENERVAEHFIRLAHVRSWYQLEHPQAMYHRSPLYRSIFSPSAGGIHRTVANITTGWHDAPLYDAATGTDTSSALARIRDRTSYVDVRDVPEPDSSTQYRRHRLDGRGLMYLRFGEPKRRFTRGLELEVWHYEFGDRLAQVVFVEMNGDMLMYPTRWTELHNATLMLERDSSSVESTLDADAWVATFRGAERGKQLVYVGAAPPSGTVALWDHEWSEVARVSGTSPFVLQASSGRHQVAVDLRTDDGFGRLREPVVVPYLWMRRASLSSILVGPVGDTAFTREDVARAMPATKRLPAADTLALYTEIYELPADSLGRARYEVEYAFVPERGGQRVTIRFDRQVRAAPVIAERIRLLPGEVPPGEYRIIVTVRDRVRYGLVWSTLVNVEFR